MGGHELAPVLQQGSDLRVERRRDVLDVVDDVGLPQEDRLRAVRCQALVGEEERIARADDALDGEVPGVAVVRMEPVALPGVVAEHDLRTERPDDPGDLRPLGEA